MKSSVHRNVGNYVMWKQSKTATHHWLLRFEESTKPDRYIDFSSIDICFAKAMSQKTLMLLWEV